MQQSLLHCFVLVDLFWFTLFGVDETERESWFHCFLFAVFSWSFTLLKELDRLALTGMKFSPTQSLYDNLQFKTKWLIHYGVSLQGAPPCTSAATCASPFRFLPMSVNFLMSAYKILWILQSVTKIVGHRAARSCGKVEFANIFCHWLSENLNDL